MSEPPDPGPVPERRPVEVAQVRRLVAEQFPQWADLRIEPVARGGWDNWTFHLGDDKLVRLPSAAAYAEAVAKEHRWLPVLAGRLPLPVPVPLALGVPGADYPHLWSVYGWLEGHTASADRIADPRTFATDLAGFLAALQAIDVTGGPRPGLHCWFRGGPLSTYDGDTRRALEDLGSVVHVRLAQRVWQEALAAPWDGVERWFHGDVAAGNLLVDDEGRLSAVIDFGTCGVGDPACDLAVAWTLLTREGRQAFHDRLGLDRATWARGRGWALWKALITLRGALEDRAPAEEIEATQLVLHTILAPTGPEHDEGPPPQRGDGPSADA